MMMGKILVLDIGGTVIKSALFQGGELTELRHTPSKTACVEERAANAIEVAKGYWGFDAVGIAITGQVDMRSRTILFEYYGHFHEGGFQIGELFEEALHCPVFVLNDSNAAALGEATYGAGRMHRDLLLLTYGTGVGGGIVLADKLYTGSRGIAAEMGHVVTHKGGRLCGCGRRGCYERYASVTALLSAAREIDPNIQNGFQFFDIVEHSVQLRKVLYTWVEEVVEGLCTIVYIFNPSLIILGGGIMERTDVIEMIADRFAHRVIPTFSQVKFRQAALGNCAGLYGAYIHTSKQLDEEGKQNG